MAHSSWAHYHLRRRSSHDRVVLRSMLTLITTAWRCIAMAMFMLRKGGGGRVLIPLRAASDLLCAFGFHSLKRVARSVPFTALSRVHAVSTCWPRGSSSICYHCTTPPLTVASLSFLNCPSYCLRVHRGHVTLVTTSTASTDDCLWSALRPGPPALRCPKLARPVCCGCVC